ncbi:MAG: adenosine deaminase family protein, partial [Candidatus Acidiferrales bacterium]
QWGGEAAVEVAHSAAKLQPYGVVAFGLGGDEMAVPTEHFRPAFQYARGEGLHLVCHAGELGGPEMVREAVDLLTAERIGHGIAVMHDHALADTLATRRIVLENCPSSNVCTGALDKQTGKTGATIADHPLRQFIERGLAVTLSTDDPSMFHTDLLTEYSRAASLGLSNEQLVRLAQESFQHSFLPPLEKRQYLDDFAAAAKSAGLL